MISCRTEMTTEFKNAFSRSFVIMNDFAGTYERALCSYFHVNPVEQQALTYTYQ